MEVDVMKRSYMIPIAVLLMVGVALTFGTFEAQGAPEAEFEFIPSEPDVDEEITFDASDSEGEKLKYYWDFGDGKDGEGVKVNHSYSKAGEYHVILVVSNATGVMDSYYETITVSGDDNEWIWILFSLGYVVVIYFFIFLFGTLAAVNLILGGVLAYRTYARAKENEKKDVATPYLIAFTISGLIGFFMSYLALISIIAHIMIYSKFKKRMKELGVDIKKKKETQLSEN